MWGGGGISGRVRALNLTVPLGSGRVGSDDLGYGPGSGFSFEPVQTSTGNTVKEFNNKTTFASLYRCHFHINISMHDSISLMGKKYTNKFQHINNANDFHICFDL